MNAVILAAREVARVQPVPFGFEPQGSKIIHFEENV